MTVLPIDPVLPIDSALADIRAALETVPEGRTPTQADWRLLSTNWRDSLQQRIDSLTQLRDQLESCIGCGCLSLKSCALYNAEDAAAVRGPGVAGGSSSFDWPDWSNNNSIGSFGESTIW